jgi:hypothetical protein
MNFEHLDDPAPPIAGDADRVVAAARRRVRARRLAGAGGALALVLGAGGVALALRDRSDGSIPIQPADTTTTVTTEVVPDGHSVTWSERGLDFEYALDYTQAVVGGPVHATLKVTNPGDEPAELGQLCNGGPAALEIHGSDGKPIRDYPYLLCQPGPVEVDGGATERYELSTDVNDGSGGPELGRYEVVLVGQGTDLSLPIEVVAPRGTSEIVADTTLGTGQVVDTTLVVHNELDALVPFSSPDECGGILVAGAFVEPGAPYAEGTWILPCLPPDILTPGRNELRTLSVEAPGAPGGYELAVDLRDEWPEGFTPPPRLAVSVEQSGEPEYVVEWSVEPTDVTVESGSTVDVEIVFTYVSHPGDVALAGDCPTYFTPEGRTAELADQHEQRNCENTFEGIDSGSRVTIPVRARYETTAGDRIALLPGEWSLHLFDGPTIHLTVT